MGHRVARCHRRLVPHLRLLLCRRRVRCRRRSPGHPHHRTRRVVRAGSRCPTHRRLLTAWRSWLRSWGCPSEAAAAAREGRRGGHRRGEWFGEGGGRGGGRLSWGRTAGSRLHCTAPLCHPEGNGEPWIRTRLRPPPPCSSHAPHDLGCMSRPDPERRWPPPPQVAALRLQRRGGLAPTPHTELHSLAVSCEEALVCVRC